MQDFLNLLDLAMASICFFSGLIFSRHAFKSTSVSSEVCLLVSALCSSRVPLRFLKLIEAFSKRGLD